MVYTLDYLVVLATLQKEMNLNYCRFNAYFFLTHKPPILFNGSPFASYQWTDKNPHKTHKKSNKFHSAVRQEEPPENKKCALHLYFTEPIMSLSWYLKYSCYIISTVVQKFLRISTPGVKSNLLEARPYLRHSGVFRSLLFQRVGMAWPLEKKFSWSLWTYIACVFSQ